MIAFFGVANASAACGARVDDVRVRGVASTPASSAAVSAAASSEAARAPAATDDDAAAFASLESVGQSFATRGHFVDGREAAILANEVAAAAFAARYGRGFAVGSLLAQRHRGPRADEPGLLFAMRKREAGYFAAGGDWEYAVVGGDGRVEQRGQLEACARCHAEAPSDWVFRSY